MFERYIPKNNKLFTLFSKLEGSQLPMFMAVYWNLKPLMDTFLTLENHDILKESCEKEGIYVGDNGIMTTFPDEDFLRRHEITGNLGTTKMTALPVLSDRPEAMVHTFISRSKELIEEARRLSWYNLFVGEYQLTQPFIDNVRYGFTLGFPSCCIQFYASHNGKFSEGKQKWGWNTPFEIIKNSLGSFSFYCNYVPMDHTYFLIHHYPCSFNCPETVRMAKVLFETIRENEPLYAEKIEHYLKLPYMVFEEKKAFAFEGKSDGNTIVYSDCYFLGERRDRSAYELIPQGDRIRIIPDYIVIYRGREKIGQYPRKGDYDGKIIIFQ